MHRSLDWARKRSFSEPPPGLFLLDVSDEARKDPSLRLPSLSERNVGSTKIVRPRSECGNSAGRHSSGLPFMDDFKNERPLTATAKWQNTFRRTRNTSPSTSKAEFDLYKLNIKNLVQPSQVKSHAAKEVLRKPNRLKTRLLEEHIVRENEHFNKNQSKKEGLMNWLQVQEWNDGVDRK